MRSLVRWTSVLLFLTGFLVGMAYLLARHFEEPVKQYFVERLNQRLRSPVHVEEMEFSLLSRFPSASLVLKNVWAEEHVITIGQADTLAAFERLYLNFNVFDLISGNYRLRGVEASRGVLHFHVDHRGDDNFHIWKTTSDTTGFLLELDRVRLTEVDFSYVNEARQQDYSLYIDDLVFRGRFSDEQYTMQVEGEGRVNHFIIKGENYLFERDIALETALDVVTRTSEYAFRKGEVLLDDRLNFSVEGKFVGDGIDLRLQGHGLDIVRSLSLIPSEDRKLLNDYESEGTLDFDCIIKGAFNKTENPFFKASFSFRDAVILQKDSDIRLWDLSGKGTIDNGSERRMPTASLRIDSLNGRIGEGHFRTAFSLIDFTHPQLEGGLSFTSGVGELCRLLRLENVKEGRGTLRVDANIRTVLHELDSLRSSDFINANASGTVRLEDVRLQLAGDVRTYEVDSATASLENNDLHIHSCLGRINGCAVDLSGVAKGFLTYLFSEGRLAIEGKVRAGEVRLEDLFPQRAEEEGGRKRAVVAFPDRMTLKVDLLAHAFQYNAFVATEVSGRLIMDAFKVQADRLHFQSQQGTVQGKAGIYHFSENQFGFRSEFAVRDIDAGELFRTFDNFGQQFLRDEHLSGQITADIAVQAFCDSLLRIDKPSVTANAHLLITQGRLSGFQPLMDVADHIREKRMLRLFVNTDALKARLADVTFDTLENEVSIRNELITIPAMTIRSSAIDIEVNGTHTFDNRIDYTLDFALSELLTLEGRKEPYNEYVQRDAKGRTRLYLRITGPADNPEVSLEKTNVRAVVRQDLQAERQTVKSLLKEEFGAFSNDTTVRELPGEQRELGVDFDPETRVEKAEKPAALPENKPEEKEKSGSVFDRLMKKAEGDKKKLREGAFEDDDF